MEGTSDLYTTLWKFVSAQTNTRLLRDFVKKKIDFFPLRLHLTGFISSCSELVGENTTLILSSSLSPKADVSESYVYVEKEENMSWTFVHSQRRIFSPHHPPSEFSF